MCANILHCRCPRYLQLYVITCNAEFEWEVRMNSELNFTSSKLYIVWSCFGFWIAFCCCCFVLFFVWFCFFNKKTKVE